MACRCSKSITLTYSIASMCDTKSLIVVLLMSLFLRNLKKANESSISFIDYHCKVSRAMVFFLGRGQNVLWATRKYMRLLQKCKHDKVRYSVNRNLRNENTYLFF